MSSLPSVVLSLGSPGTSHEEALNATVMTHGTSSGVTRTVTTGLVIFVALFVGPISSKRVLCLLTLCLSVICWAIWFVQHLTQGVLCQRLTELVFCLHVSLKSRLWPEWTRDLSSSQSVIQIRLHSGALVPNCHPELYSIYQIHPVEKCLYLDISF